MLIDDDEIVRKDTAVIINPHELRKRIGKETLVITGSSRGGTSIAAYAYRRAGYELGEKINSTTHEDIAVLAAVKDGNLDELIRSRNATHARWGFKMPEAVRILRELDKKLRNPVFIVAYRNPLEIGKSKSKRSPHFSSGKFGLIAGIKHGIELLQEATQACKDIRAPALLINIDAVHFAPRSLTRELLEFASPGVDDELIDLIAEEISKTGYKKLLAADIRP